MTSNVYLKPNVVAEPLFNNWYAWSYLIAPATAAMYMSNLHVKIMQSFVMSPQIHVAALKNPAMMGGPFLNYDASRVENVKSLLKRTTQHGADLLELAEGLKQLDRMLTAEATGYSLEPLYENVPDAMKGYIELF